MRATMENHFKQISRLNDLVRKYTNKMEYMALSIQTAQGTKKRLRMEIRHLKRMKEILEMQNEILTLENERLRQYESLAGAL